MPMLSKLVDELAREGDFNGAVRVDTGERVLLSAAYGLADRARRIRNTTATRFATASGTKLLTALAVGSLIEDGRCSLDSRLCDVLSFDLPGVSSDVSVEHLLTHTSGVYDYYDEEVIQDFDHFELAIPKGRLQKPTDYLPLVTAGRQKFPPGSRFCYSNGGYVLLGMLVEELTGDYHRCVEDRVMKRAQMHASGFFRLDALPERTATGYRKVEGGWRSNADVLPVIGGPDGGAFVTLRDMTRLWRALLCGELLSGPLTQRFVSKAAHSSGQEHYGYGLWIDDDGCRAPILSVAGSDPGVAFASSYYSGGIVATVASNTSDGAWPIAKAIKRYLHHELDT